MKYTLPDTIGNLIPYQPISGEYRVRLDANESYFQLNEDQLELFCREIKQIAYNRYPDSTAEKLCEAFADYYQIHSELVTAFDGSDESLALLSSAFFAPGQKLAAFRQDFSMYRLYAQMYGTECIVLEKKEDLTIDVDQVLKEIREKQISALIFSNPCNPTSIGLSRSEVIRLIESTDALIIVDEAYMDFWDQSVLDLAGKYENLIVLKTCSKAIGLASIRLGFTITTPKLTQVLRAVKSPYNVNTVSQVLGTVILKQKEYLRYVVNEIIKSRNWLQEKAKELEKKFPLIISAVYSSDTNFIYIKTPFGKQIFDELLRRSVAIRYMGDYLRITAGSKEENTMLINQLESIITVLSKEGSL